MTTSTLKSKWQDWRPVVDVLLIVVMGLIAYMFTSATDKLNIITDKVIQNDKNIELMKVQVHDNKLGLKENSLRLNEYNGDIIELQSERRRRDGQ